VKPSHNNGGVVDLYFLFCPVPSRLSLVWLSFSQLEPVYQQGASTPISWRITIRPMAFEHIGSVERKQSGLYCQMESTRLSVDLWKRKNAVFATTGGDTIAA
jgi:hypothetical protein